MRVSGQGPAKLAHEELQGNLQGQGLGPIGAGWLQGHEALRPVRGDLTGEQNGKKAVSEEDEEQ